MTDVFDLFDWILRDPFSKLLSTHRAFPKPAFGIVSKSGISDGNGILLVFLTHHKKGY